MQMQPLASLAQCPRQNVRLNLSAMLSAGTNVPANVTASNCGALLHFFFAGFPCTDMGERNRELNIRFLNLKKWHTECARKFFFV